MWLTPSVVRYNTRLSTCMICFVFLSFTKLYGLAILLYGNESHKLTDKSPNPSDTRLIHQRLLPSSLDFPVLQPRRRGQSGASWPRHQIVQAQYIHNVSTFTAKIFPKRKKKKNSSPKAVSGQRYPCPAWVVSDLVEREQGSGPEGDEVL